MTDKPLGSCFDTQGNCTFRVFAPKVDNLSVRLYHGGIKDYSMQRDSLGFHEVNVDKCPDGI